MDLRRVTVIGTSCSGKTTFARTLAAILESPHFELDAIHWRPNWTAASDDDFRTAVKKATSGERWVVDGNYSVVQDLVWGRTTAIIWLNYPFGLVFGRALRRTIRRVVRKEVLFSGNRETFRDAFLSRHSILLWVIRTHHRRGGTYRKLLAPGAHPGIDVVEISRPSDANRFLDALRGEPREGAP